MLRARRCRWASTISGSRRTTFSTITARCSTPASRPQVTQQLLQGAGIWVNKRFMYQALNDRRITDSSFRQQILYTVNQVETIYWGLVQAYEDVQAKERALEQSQQLLSDNKKQLEIGTMAPLDVVQRGIERGSGRAVADQRAERTELPAADHQAGHRAQPERSHAVGGAGDSDGSREPGAAARGEPAGGGAGAGGIPAEAGAGAGGADAAQRRDHAEGRAERASADADVYGFYGGYGIGGSQSPSCLNLSTFAPCPPNTYPTVGYGAR